MAPDGDPENAVNINEHTPLLEDPHLDPQSDQSSQKHKRVNRYIWRIFWVIVAALVIGIFVKGWIDAGGDVDVGGLDARKI